jgi:hypothetical protein
MEIITAVGIFITATALAAKITDKRNAIQITIAVMRNGVNTGSRCEIQQQKQYG